MKKSLYISAIALMAMSFSSCVNEVEDYFETNAAQRLEDAMNDYEDLLMADGGKWRMEYFCNADEEGYNYIFTFKNDGSVTISGKNKYIGYEYTSNLEALYKSESSLWSVIADNGPVLSLSSFNRTFHIFSSPDDVPGTTNPDTGTDIDESGHGHEGDYEFMFMEAIDNDTLRLKGKKGGYTIMMYRLPADFEDETYFNDVDAMSAKIYNSKFKKLFLIYNGERYVMTGLDNRIFSFYPESGDAVTQVTSLNGLVKADGFMFPYPIEIYYPNTFDQFAVQNFVYNEEDGTLKCKEIDATIRADYFTNLLNTNGYVWQFTDKDVEGQFATVMADVVAQCKSQAKETFRYFEFCYDNDGVQVLRFKSGRYTGEIYCNIVKESETTAKVVFTGEYKKNAKYYMENLPAFQQMCDLLSSATLTFSSPSLLIPTALTASLNDSDKVTLKLQ